MPEPISLAVAAITAVTGAVISAGPLAVAAFNAINVIGAAALAAEAFKVLQPEVRQSGASIEWEANPNAALPFAFGRVGVSGNIVANRVYGPDDMYVGFVSVVSAAGPIKSFVSFKADDTSVSFDASGKAVTSYHANVMWRRTQLGRQPEPSALSSPSGLKNGVTMPGWGASYKLSGKAAYIWTLSENSKRSAYEGRVPTPLNVIEGLYCWDPRLDSTYPGGSGTCRLNDPSTWVWRENPALFALKWALGLWEGPVGKGAPQMGFQVGGIGAKVENVRVDRFVELANIADANGWKAAAWPKADEPKDQVLDSFLQAAGAVYADEQGKISCIQRAAARPSILTITSDDIAGTVEYDTTTSKIGRLNTIRPRYWSAANDWQMAPTDEVSATLWREEDGQGQAVTRSKGIDFNYVPGSKQARELACLLVAHTREGIRGTVPVRSYVDVEPGDAFDFQVPEATLNGLKCLVLNTEPDLENDTVIVTFASESDGKYAYAYGQADAPPPAPELEPSDPTYVTPPLPGDWTIVPRPPSPGGSQLPGFDLGGVVSNDTADSVIVEHGPSNTGPWKQAYEGPPTVTNIPIDGLQPGTTYYVAIRYRRDNNYSERYVYGPYVAPALVADNTINLGQEPVQDVLDRLTSTAELAQSVSEAVDELEAVYGDTASAAASAADAAAALADTIAAKADAVIAKGDAEGAAADALDNALAAAGAADLASSKASDASGSATAASGFAATASTKATAAGNSATAANASKVAAESARDAAQGSATAAAGSASSAATSSTQAGQSASAAATAKTQAETARGQAQTFRDEASNSATSAAGSASTATTQAGLATTAKNDAAGYASAALTSRNQASSFADDAETAAAASMAASVTASTAAIVSMPDAISADLLTILLGGDPLSVAGVPSEQVASGVYTSPASATYVALKAVLPWVQGRIYEITATVEGVSGPAGGFGVFVQRLGAAYNSLGGQQIGTTVPAQVGSKVSRTQRIACGVDGIADATNVIMEPGQWMRPVAIFNRVAGSSVSLPVEERHPVKVSRLWAKDITSQVLATGAATASASNAANAAASETAAGQKAAAAETSRVQAETARGQAQTAATNAATSQTNAAGSASQASISQQAAANSRDAAAGSASAAAGHASTASTKAGEAGTHAAAALAAQVTATTAKDAALGAAITSIPAVVSSELWTSYATPGAPASRTNLYPALIINGAFAAPDAMSTAGPKQHLKYEFGKVYEVTAVITATGNTTPAFMRFIAEGFTDQFTRVPSTTASGNHRAPRGSDATVSARFAMGVAAADAWLVPDNQVWTGIAVQINIASVGNTPVSGADVRVKSLTVRDVTAQVAAETAATASATSASNASASETAAGQKATAAEGSAATASTKAGEAQTFRNQAATSASDAAGSAVTASQASGTAVSARDTAIGARNDAQAAAATAVTQASNASASAASAQISANVAAQVGGGASNRNSAFTEWPATGNIPTSWTTAGSGTYAKVAAASGVGNAWRHTSSGSASMYGYSEAAASAPGGEWAVIQAEIKLVSGNLRGAGLRLTSAAGGSATKTSDCDFALEPDATGVVRGNGVAGSTYRFSKLVDARAAGTNQYTLYALTRFFSPTSSVIIEWQRVAWRPATPEEIAAGSVLPAIQSQLSITAATTADLATRMATARFEVIAAAGSDPAQLVIRADTSGSVARLVASAISFANVVNGTIVEAMKLIGGEVFFMRPIYIDVGDKRLIVGPGGTWVLWFGGNDKSAALATRTNGIFCLGTDGKVYYGSAELGGASNQLVKRLVSGAYTLPSSTSWTDVATFTFTGSIPAGPIITASVVANGGGPPSSGFAYSAATRWVERNGSGDTVLDASGSFSGSYNNTEGVMEWTASSSAITNKAGAKSGTVTYVVQAQRTSGTAASCPVNLTGVIEVVKSA